MRKEKSNYTDREKRLMELEDLFVSEFVKLRHDNGLTQQKMADSANVIRETIARIENKITSPQVNTLIKILEPLGYTIKIEKINKK
ncbi:MAG: helix-turn-helix transcriptional regulator [Bacilli bacterium]|nr:helix-turn-helix transcriptional regulator [Bacilli bacterium]